MSETTASRFRVGSPRAFKCSVDFGKGADLSLGQGAMYNDDFQDATNYPLVRITNTATGHVFYARTHNHSSMGVATGSLIVTTHFDVPAGIELGGSKLEVVANGIASSPVSVVII